MIAVYCKECGVRMHLRSADVAEHYAQYNYVCPECWREITRMFGHLCTIPVEEGKPTRMKVS